MKKWYIGTATVLLLAALFVAADYFALFGTHTENRFDFYELTFKTVDEESGAPVVDVHVRCFQKNNLNACAEKKSKRPGYLQVNVPVTKIISRTLLFEKNIAIQQTFDPKVHIMFIHHDYAKPVETILVQDLPTLAGGPIEIAMPPQNLFRKR